MQRRLGLHYTLGHALVTLVILSCVYALASRIPRLETECQGYNKASHAKRQSSMPNVKPRKTLSQSTIFLCRHWSLLVLFTPKNIFDSSFEAFRVLGQVSRFTKAIFVSSSHLRWHIEIQSSTTEHRAPRLTGFSGCLGSWILVGYTRYEDRLF